MSIAATCPECRCYTCICTTPPFDLYAEVQKAQERKEQECQELARIGEVRCWLNGTNPDDDKLVMTVYGPLTAEQRRRVLDFATEIDTWPVEPRDTDDTTTLD